MEQLLKKLEADEKKVKSAKLMWERFLETEDSQQMIREACDIDNTLMMKLLSHNLQKGIYKIIQINSAFLFLDIIALY